MPSKKLKGPLGLLELHAHRRSLTLRQEVAHLQVGIAERRHRDSCAHCRDIDKTIRVENERMAITRDGLRPFKRARRGK